MTDSKQTPGFVLLSAGRGTRMAPLTDGIPKGMLPAGEKLVLDWMLEAILARSNGEVVVVTGYGANAVESHLDTNYPNTVQYARNSRYAQDVNIFSVETGVNALQHPERGYVVVETDMLVDSQSWDQIFDAVNETTHSYWVCKGFYSKSLTGGIIHADADGQIDAIDYQPQYDPQFDNWNKQLGMLIVGPGQVEADKRLRSKAVAQSIAQYYMVPWVHGIKELPCRVLSLSPSTAQPFNTIEEFESACSRFLHPPKAVPRALPPGVFLADVAPLRHIEGFSDERVDWLAEKITKEGLWTKPIAIDDEHNLVLDGQHRLQVARRLGLSKIPALSYPYADIEVFSLRPEIQLDWQSVVQRSLANNPYPYKTVKHRFPGPVIPEIAIDLKELSQ